MNEILAVRTCEAKPDGFIYCPCDNRDNKIEMYPTLSVHVGQNNLQHWFYMEARDYFIYDRYYKKCLLTLLEEPNGSSFAKIWLMGDPFLRKYYSIYDMDAKRVGLVGVAESTRIQFEDSFEEKVEDVGDFMGEALDGFLNSMGIDSSDIVFQVVSAIVCSIIMMCCCWCCQRLCRRCCSCCCK